MDIQAMAYIKQRGFLPIIKIDFTKGFIVAYTSGNNETIPFAEVANLHIESTVPILIIPK